LRASDQQKSRKQNGQQCRRAFHTSEFQIHFLLGLLLLVGGIFVDFSGERYCTLVQWPSGWRAMHNVLAQ
jgi:hypothetical protein